MGLHANADMTKDMQEVNLLLDSLLLTQSRDGSGGGKSPEEIIGDVANEILTNLPPNFDTEVVAMKYPQNYYDSMNTVLVQELGRVNNLLTKIRSSLINLGKAVKGLALMSAELDTMGVSLFNGKIPDMWLKVSFPSLKPLGAYVAEVHERVQEFVNWVENGPPTVFWLSGFFFTQAFMTGARQNFARKFKIPIDEIDFDFLVKDGETDCQEPPDDGVFVRGMYLEGCRWNYDTHVLDESEPKVLFTAMPKLWMLPTETTKFKEFQHYVCPLYKTTARRGILSTTGHSTNFVMDVRVPSDRPASHWTKRGVALMCSLND